MKVTKFLFRALNIVNAKYSHAKEGIASRVSIALSLVAAIALSVPFMGQRLIPSFNISDALGPTSEQFDKQETHRTRTPENSSSKNENDTSSINDASTQPKIANTDFSASSSSTGATESDGRQNVDVTINGQQIDVPSNGNVHKQFTSNGQTSTVDISVDGNTSSNNTSTSSTVIIQHNSSSIGDQNDSAGVGGRHPIRR